jgi:hypothetical protein
VTGPGGKPVKGCYDDEIFIPEDPLRRGTTYKAIGVWGLDAPTTPFSWSFTMAGTAPGCRANVEFPRGRSAVRPRHGLRVRYRACGPGRLIVTFRHKRKVALRRVRRVRTAGRGTLTVRQLRRGRFIVVARLTGTRRARTRRAISVVAR